jgi:hypothetical protein
MTNKKGENLGKRILFVFEVTPTRRGREKFQLRRS